MSESLKELRALPDDKLISLHDELARSTQVGIDHYLAELSRRDQDRQTQAMLRYTRWITIMTGVMLISTILNILLAFSVYATSCTAGP